MATLTKCTLLDLVQTIGDYAASDAETVATVAYLINSGKVLLCGNFAGARIDLSAPAYAAPPTTTPWTHFRELSFRRRTGLRLFCILSGQET